MLSGSAFPLCLRASPSAIADAYRMAARKRLSLRLRLVTAELGAQNSGGVLIQRKRAGRLPALAIRCVFVVL